jgi:hypothetical protein
MPGAGVDWNVGAPNGQQLNGSNGMEWQQAGMGYSAQPKLGKLGDGQALAKYTAQGQIQEAAALAAQSSYGEVGQNFILTALISVPQQFDLESMYQFIAVLAQVAIWDSPDAVLYFERKTRQAFQEFHAEAESVFAGIATRDHHSLCNMGNCWYDVKLCAGANKGEICVSGWNQGDVERRGIQNGDMVGIVDVEFSMYLLEFEVVTASRSQMIVKPFAEGGTEKLLGVPQGTKMRVDRLANRQQFSRVLRAIHVACSPRKLNTKQLKYSVGKSPRSTFANRHRPMRSWA